MPPLASWSDYREAVARFIGAIDGVIERGRAAELRYEIFLRHHGIEPGSGEQHLRDGRIPAREQHQYLELLRLTRSAHEALGGASPTRVAPAVGAATRALASRHRI